MRDDRGFALVTVLWTLVLLTLLAGLVMQTARTSTSLERNAWRRLQAEAAAETGFTQAILSLLETRADKRWPIDGREVRIIANGLPLVVTIQDELGRIDLNTAPRELLASLFASTGMSQTAAETLADATLERRLNSSNAVSRATTAPQGVQRTVGQRVPFRNIDELRSIPGITEKLFEQIRPAVTVYSRRPMIDPGVAPRQVLIAMPGATNEAVRGILEQRLTSSEANATAAAPLSGRAFTIVVRIDTNAVGARMERTIRLLPQGKPAYWLLHSR